MTAEPSASIWEVTRLILESPDLSPSEIAQEHGYTAAEIAELMPIFLDTARTDWSVAADNATDWAHGADAGPGRRAVPARPGGQRLHRGGRLRRPGRRHRRHRHRGHRHRTPMTAATGRADLGELSTKPTRRARRPGRLRTNSTGSPQRRRRRPGRPGARRLGRARRRCGPAPRPSSTPPDLRSRPCRSTATADADPDDGFELGEDDPFERRPLRRRVVRRPTGFDYPDERADVETDDVGDPFAG